MGGVDQAGTDQAVAVWRRSQHDVATRDADYLSYSLFAPRPGLEDRPENYFEMRYQLAEQAGATVVTIIQNDPRPPAAGEAASDGSRGENAILQGLKTVAEAL
jgi:hypothetical protein